MQHWFVKTMHFMVFLSFPDILKDTMKPYTADDSNKFKTVVVFDCRGVEPVDFSPRVRH